MVTDRTDRICVIGAGSSGLAAARNLQAHGIAVEVLEREDDLGGNWNYGQSCARVYRSTHIITSKRCTEFPDFPMPEEYPDFPHHSQILAYFRAYADHFGLGKVIAYRTPVARVEPAGEGQLWDVALETGEVRRYGGVVIANGHNWSPKWPRYPGEFTGEVIHSAQYKTPHLLEGRRVLVVGGGNSGCDIAVEAAQNTRETYHSTRRGYHYIPKYLFGRPSDKLADRLLRLGLPLWLRRALAALALRLMVGRPEKFGLPTPDHRLYETHPINNSLLLYYVGHGDIRPRPDIARFAGRRVEFVDGSAAEVDVIVFATGYNIVFPFIDNEHLNWRDGRPRLFKNVFHPHYDTLFVAGLIQPDSGQFGLVHWQMKAVACFLEALRRGDRAAEALRARKRKAEEDLGGGVRYKDSTRHHLEVEHWSYRTELQRLVRDLSPRRRAA